MIVAIEQEINVASGLEYLLLVRHTSRSTHLEDRLATRDIGTAG